MLFKLGELFCGPGGIALGAHRAAAGLPEITLQHAWATDYDGDTVQTYISNIPGASESTVLHADVRKLDLKTLAPIDALAFGFPCNDFSLVGKQRGTEGVFGPLYTYGVAALEAHQPKWFIAENVGGLRSSNEGNALGQILAEMSTAGRGYKLVPHLYKFEEYGLPQRRHRIIIVGIRSDIDVEFKVPSTAPYKTINNSVSHRLSNPPIQDSALNNERTKQSQRVIERLKHIKPGENAFNADLPEHLKLNVKGAQISQIYKRLEANKPSYTITGSGGGGTHVYHWEEPRALTNRERARIQTFPDDFVFQGSKESVRKQVGMAVPVEGAEIVVSAILKSFLGIPYETTNPNMTKYFS